MQFPDLRHHIFCTSHSTHLNSYSTISGLDVKNLHEKNYAYLITHMLLFFEKKYLKTFVSRKGGE